MVLTNEERVPVLEDAAEKAKNAWWASPRLQSEWPNLDAYVLFTQSCALRDAESAPASQTKPVRNGADPVRTR